MFFSKNWLQEQNFHSKDDFDRKFEKVSIIAKSDIISLEDKGPTSVKMTITAVNPVSVNRFLSYDFESHHNCDS